ncbi:hypothetical protein EDEG_01313 [Edhazardia aedis USNM 41457]|uniref:UspA domain-containing protein n=1 Tax=Edhazardia aedis (strain USNM 41457) TaxID=1003232 RepID=J8ZXM3_EDHAE|nr:hypothetical protein EDEG_01313 [Edhazardia aedis USNM 41457]|eukprot:EJW04443.1 hypothetical protein EDEG_01313 [Edhazardia aedis USNM 41457]
MRTIAIVFQNIQIYNSQVDFALKDFIDPVKHRLLLIFLLPETFFVMNDPWSMLFSRKLLNYQSDCKKDLIRKMYKHVEKQIEEEVGFIDICKIILHGNERKKLEAILKSLGVSLVLLSAEAHKNIFSKLFIVTIDDFLVDKARISVLRAPYIDNKS